MTEADTESIWDCALDTTRFGKINVRIGEVLNMWVNEDAATDVTNTAVLPMLEQLSEQALQKLIAASKMTGIQNPWDFIQANVANITAEVITENYFILDKIADILQKHHHIKYSNKLTLPSHSD